MPVNRPLLGAAIFLLTFVSTTVIVSAQESEPRTLIVGTKVAEPFSMKNEDGSWTGISIELWRQIADELNLTWEIREYDLAGLLDGLADSSVDIGMAALTLSPEREVQFDFSHPFYTTGLSIATRNTVDTGLLSLIGPFLSWRFLQIIGTLILVLFAVGVVVWLFERRHNADEFGGSTAHGLGSAFWWSAVTMTTVGYGDKAPRTLGGRLVALVWMLAAITIISSFTAAIASVVTVSQLDLPVKGPSDLPHVAVGTVNASVAQDYLQQEGLAHRNYPNINEALSDLETGKLDAVVYDAPILKYIVKQTYTGRIRVLPGTFEPQEYGIGLPAGSTLREPINRALLRVTSRPQWKNMLSRYLGR